MIRALRQVRGYLHARAYITVYLLMSVAVFVNILQFRVINGQSGRNYKALHVHESSDVLLLGTTSESVRARWLPWITFSKIAPNSTVFIPAGSYFDHPGRVDDKLHSYGDVFQIFKINLTSAEILKGINPEDFMVASIEDVAEGSPYYAFAMKTDDKNTLITSSIRGMATVEDLPFHNGANFALVEWGGIETTFHPTEKIATAEFYGLFIETSLLSEEVRTKLQGP